MNRAASSLAKQRWRHRQLPKVCPFCGQEFLGDTQQVYCTPAHQEAAAARRFRARQRDGTPSPRSQRAPSEPPVDARPMPRRTYELALAGLLTQAEEARAAGHHDLAAKLERQAAAIASHAPSPVLAD